MGKCWGCKRRQANWYCVGCVGRSKMEAEEEGRQQEREEIMKKINLVRKGKGIVIDVDPYTAYYDGRTEALDELEKEVEKRGKTGGK